MTVDGLEEVKEVSVVKDKGLYSVVTNEVLTLCSRTSDYVPTDNRDSLFAPHHSQVLHTKYLSFMI